MVIIILVLRNELVSRVDEEAKMEQEIILPLKNKIETQKNEIMNLKIKIEN
jgi:hypothetical protein